MRSYRLSQTLLWRRSDAVIIFVHLYQSEAACSILSIYPTKIGFCTLPLISRNLYLSFTLQKLSVIPLHGIPICTHHAVLDLKTVFRNSATLVYFVRIHTGLSSSATLRQASPRILRPYLTHHKSRLYGGCSGTSASVLKHGLAIKSPSSALALSPR